MSSGRLSDPPLQRKQQCSAGLRQTSDGSNKASVGILNRLVKYSWVVQNEWCGRPARRNGPVNDSS